MDALYTLDAAAEIADEIKSIVRTFARRVEIAGSVRRRKPEDIKDIELVVLPQMEMATVSLFETGLVNVTNIKLDELDELGMIEADRSCWGEKHRKFRYGGITIDFYTADLLNFGYIHMLRTGDKDFSHLMVTPRQHSVDGVSGLKPSVLTCKDGYVWRGKNKIELPDERRLFDAWGFQPIAPHLRNLESAKTIWRKSL